MLLFRQQSDNHVESSLSLHYIRKISHAKFMKEMDYLACMIFAKRKISTEVHVYARYSCLKDKTNSISMHACNDHRTST